jgi:hypothetical protein
MVRMLADEGSAITRDFVGNEAAARHYFNCQWPVASSQKWRIVKTVMLGLFGRLRRIG